MPLLNAAIRGCTEKQLKQMLIVILVVFVFYDNITRKFGMEEGYTCLWLILLYIIGFSKISFPQWCEKAIAFMAKGAFAVYLLNNQRFVWKYIMDKQFVFLSEKPAVVLIGVVLGFALCFVVIAILVDHARMFLFRVLGINKIVQKLSDGIEKCFDRVKG